MRSTVSDASQSAISSATFSFGTGPETFITVPGPIAGAGLPGLVAACGALLALARRRRHQARSPPLAKIRPGSPARRTAVGPDIGQLTRGSRGSKRAGRVAEGKAQVTDSLASTYDGTRAEQIADRHREQTAAGRESSAR